MKHLPPILLIDDGASDREVLSLVLRGAFGDTTIDTVDDAADLTRALLTKAYGLVLLDPEIAWIGGDSLIDIVRERLPEAAIVVATRDDGPATATWALKAGADGFLIKNSEGLARSADVIRTALFWSRRRRSSDASAANRILDGLPVGVFVTDSSGVILDGNPALAHMLGHRRPADLSHRPFREFFTDPAAARGFEAAVAGTSPVLEMEAEIKASDDLPRWVRIRLRPAPPSPGMPPRLHGLVEDIDDHRRALDALERRSDDLDRSVHDLEELAYVVSHDLQQPLGLLEHALESIDREDGTADPKRVTQARRASAALDRMIGAILRLTRLERQDLDIRPVDLNRVLDRVTGLLETEIAAAEATIEVEPLPTVFGDGDLLAQLFQNLVGNALKYHGADPPEIRIGEIEDPHRWHLTVADNGIGIEPVAAERIFKMFQRLHTNDEIPGTGIGLAVCRRIVTRHGGKIWVESAPGAGAIFHVTIPRKEGSQP